MNFAFNNDLLNIFLGTLLSLVAAGFAWFIKTAYDHHKRQQNSIGRMEKNLSFNLASLDQYTNEIQRWLGCIESQRRFLNTNFPKIFIEDEKQIFISDLELLNKVIKVNFPLRGFKERIEIVYEDYKKVVELHRDEKMTRDEFLEYCKSLKSEFQLFPDEISPVKDNIIEALAHLKLFAENRARYSVFGFFDRLNKDFLP